MKSIIEKYRILITVIIFIITGLFFGIRYYYYSKLLIMYWIFCGILSILCIFSKIFLLPLNKRQHIALISIIGIYFLCWIPIPHFLRFGMFLFITLCFLYSGVLIYNTNYLFAKIVFIIAFIVSFFNLSSLFFFIAERTDISQTLIGTLFISNPQEANEYFKNNLSIYHLIVLLIFLISTLFLFKKQNTPTFKINISIILLFIMSFSMSCVTGPFGAFSSEYFIFLREKNNLKNMMEARKNGKNMNFNFEKEKNGANKVVIIIGESLNRTYMSLYGYEKDTSPNLLKLVSDTSEGKLFYFDNVISPEVTTSESLRLVLTNINNDNALPFEKSVTLIDLFKKAGFETFWISNQFPLGKYDTPTSAIASHADSMFFTTYQNDLNKNASKGTYYDGDLLTVFGDLIHKSQKTSKQVFFIHLLGSHATYGDRYPKEFNIFNSKKADDKNSYLNSVYYNDWVVSSFIKLAQTNSVDVVCYFSDHGEDLDNFHNPEKYSIDMSLVPFVVYLSNDYIHKQPTLAINLLKNKHTPAMTDNFFHDIQEIISRKSSLYDSSKSFLSENFLIKKRKIINNSIVFD